MSKYKIMSYLFLLLAVMVIAASSYLVITYASELLNSVVNFSTTHDYSALQQCGISLPSQFSKLRTEFTTFILPILYLGIPALLIVLSAIMFLSGFYYHRGRVDDASRAQAQLEREMVHKIVKKMAAEKSQGTDIESAGTYATDASNSA